MLIKHINPIIFCDVLWKSYNTMKMSLQPTVVAKLNFFGANKNIIWRTTQFLNALLELFYQFNSTKEPSNSEVHQKQIRSVVGWDDMNRIQNTNWYEQDQKEGQANISKVVRKFQLVQMHSYDQICTGIYGRNVWEFLWFKKKVSGIAVCHKSP